MADATPPAGGEPPALADVLAQNAALRVRLQELEDTLESIHSGDVDALIVNGGVYTLESAQESGSRMRQDVLAQMKDAVFAFDLDDHVVYLNAAAERRYGVAATQVLGRHRRAVFTESAPPPDAEHRLADGSAIRVEAIVSPLHDAQGVLVGSLAVIRDVSQRHREQVRRDALSRLSDRLRDLDDPEAVGFEASRILGELLGVSRVGFAAIDAAAETLHVVRDWTAPGIESMAGVKHLRDFGSFIDNLKRNEFVAIEDVREDERTAAAAAALERYGARSFVNAPVVERGQLVAVFFVNDAVVRRWSADDLHFVRDMAERLRAMMERLRAAAALRHANENLEQMVANRTRDLMAAEDALRQAQKMEAVGQLTGGIAHDFNNLLASISASLQVMQVHLARGRTEGLARYLDMAQDAVRRAAALTQRLLAFARRQTLAPKPTDVNRLVEGMADLIARSVGPAVELHRRREDALWVTRVDASQLESSLLNLCINARDAMLPAGGRLVIATANERVDEGRAAELELAAGDYVVLRVTDSGTGMAPEVAERIFDPFFTTKPMGQGTGLGLSMVYGFVRQSGGQVRVRSAPGEGSSFRLYLPRHDGPADEDVITAVPASSGTGRGEHVLVVEDEETIRTLIAETLVEAGYAVATARDGIEGLAAVRGAGAIDLLLSDVGLPGGVGGRQLADAARALRPGVRVIFMTGYADSAADREGLLAHGDGVLTKPLDLTMLVQRIRTTLDGR